MTRFSSLESERLRIRRFEAADAAPFLAYRRATAAPFGQEWATISSADTRRFIQELEHVEPGVPGLWFQFAVEHKAQCTLIGDMALHVRKDAPGHAEIGYTLATAYRNQGYGFEMVSTLLDYAFATFNLQRVTAKVLAENPASINLLERLSFQQAEGEAEQILLNGGPHRVVTFALFQPAWSAARAEDLKYPIYPR